MKLRLKVLIILASVWALISVVTYTYSKITLTKEYNNIEIKEVRENLTRTTSTLHSMFLALTTLNFDWAQWDDAYKFLQHKNKPFIDSNLSFTTFENSKLNLILFFDTQGKFYYGLNYDLAAKKFVPIPDSLIKQLEAQKAFTMQRNVNASKSGLMEYNNKYIALSALPVVTSKGLGPIRGTLIMGFFLNKEHLAQLSDIVKMNVNLDMLPIAKSNQRMQLVNDYLEGGNNSYIQIVDDNNIMGYTYIRDIDNNPIGIISVNQERPVYQEGIKTINEYLGILIVIGIFLLASIWYLLKVVVLDRVIDVSKQVIYITNNSAFNRRIAITGNDELNQMVMAMNSLVEIIALTEEKLKSRISLRTEELERLALLNKNLFAEMTNQKQIEMKLREGEKRLHHMAYYDVLTGLPNRLYFNDIAQKTIEKARILNMSLAILFIDVDKFKQINDTYGHDIGDLYLRHIAEQLKSSIKEIDVAARLSGDEFLICLSDVTDKTQIGASVDQILKNLSLPLKVDGISITSTFSVGISIYPMDGANITKLEKHADLAMYYAKKQMNSVYCFYSEIAKSEVTD